LKFDVTGISDDIQAATLRVYATETMPVISAHSVNDTTWDETTITWDNQPPIGAELNTQTNIDAGDWAQFDVTSYISGNGVYSLALTTTATGAYDFAAKEHAAYPPAELLITCTYIPADINKNGTVDIYDLKELTDAWLTNSPAAADIAPGAGDGKVNMIDFDELAVYWPTGN
jgi:hypothetical protein